MNEQQPPHGSPEATTQQLRRPRPGAGRTEVMSLDDLMDLAAGSSTPAETPAPADEPAAPAAVPIGAGGAARPRVPPFPMSLASPPARPAAAAPQRPRQQTWHRLRDDAGRAGRDAVAAVRSWLGTGDRAVLALTVAAAVVLLAVVGLL